MVHFVGHRPYAAVAYSGGAVEGATDVCVCLWGGVHSVRKQLDVRLGSIKIKKDVELLTTCWSGLDGGEVGMREVGAGARASRSSKQNKTKQKKTKRYGNNSEDPESRVLLLDKPGSS